MKLAVIGGGSTYTPELVDGVARLSDDVKVDELRRVGGPATNDRELHDGSPKLTAKGPVTESRGPLGHRGVQGGRPPELAEVGKVRTVPFAVLTDHLLRDGYPGN